MLQTKPCHSGLKPRGRLFGLEAIDLLLLAPGLYIGSVVVGQPALALAATVVGGVALRLLKWGRLPGYTLALAHYLSLPPHAGTLGTDNAVPAYPVVRVLRGAL